MASKLTNTQIKNIVNLAYKEFTGQEGDDVTIDLTQFTDLGNPNLGDLRSRFTGKLLATIGKNWFMDSSYRSNYRDVFYEDSARFGSIMQQISVTVPEVKDNSAWTDFVSGTSTLGNYTVFLPVVNTKYYCKTESWALPITLTGTQLDDAFKDEEGLSQFVSYCHMCVDNAICQHLEDMNALNRNNFMAEKIRASRSGATGVHVFDLVKKYVEDRGITTTFTIEDAHKSKDYLNWAMAQIKLYKGYMAKQSVMFNLENAVRFTPKDRMVCQMLGDFATRVQSVAIADTFNKEFVEMPKYEEVATWQSMEDLSYNGVSSINVKCASGDVISQSGIVCFLADSWGVLHTVKTNRVASHYFPIEDMTHTEYQYRDSYMNNLGYNAIVFIESDYTPEDVTE